MKDAYTAPESASVAVSINAERPEVVAPKIDSSTVVTTTTTLPEQSTTPPPTAEHISAPPTEALEASTTSSTATTTAPGKEQSTNAQANTEEPEVVQKPFLQMSQLLLLISFDMPSRVVERVYRREDRGEKEAKGTLAYHCLSCRAGSCDS